MPKPRENESHDEYMQRCMSDDEMVNQFPDSSQRYAVCQSYWDNKKSEEKTEKEGIKKK